MTLVTSGQATGRRCPVCGSPDGGCGGAHAGTEPSPVDAPLYLTAQAARVPDVIVSRTINGIQTQLLANSEEAEAHGWPIVSAIGGGPFHKKRPAPGPDVTPSAPEPAEPPPPAEPEPAPEPEDTARRAELEAQTKPEVYDLAGELDIAGRSSMTKPELVAAILEAEAAAG